jgi:GNAT superfamily N-acetyltransferase
MALSLTQCEDRERWGVFVESSPQGNIFCSTPFLDALGEDYDLLLVEENSIPRLGAIVLKRRGKPLNAPYPFTLYQGILFDGSGLRMPRHSRIKRELLATEFLLAEMEKQYDRISFCLHYAMEDLRSFQWFHYHEQKSGLFTLDLRYTGLLDIEAVKDFESYLATTRECRRDEFRRAQSEGATVEVSNDWDMLDELHRLTFARQGIERSEDEKRLLRAISKAAISRGFGQLLVCRNKEGAVASATLFLFDSRCAYYLFAANDPDYRKTGCGTYLMLEAIRRCIERGLAKVDFVGINSPNRGDFKTSFNAVPTPYFIATWQKPNSSLPLSSEETNLESSK